MPESCGYEGYDFGGGYIDSVCIDGELWDLDSCDEPGGPLFSGGEIPCPACETLKYLEWIKEDLETGCYQYIDNEEIWKKEVKWCQMWNPESDNIAKSLEPVNFLHWDDD